VEVEAAAVAAAAVAAAVAATELSVSSLPTKGCELKGRGKIFAVLTIPLVPDMCLSYGRCGTYQKSCVSISDDLFRIQIPLLRNLNHFRSLKQIRKTEVQIFRKVLTVYLGCSMIDLVILQKII
jgi:hypothetical protein